MEEKPFLGIDTIDKDLLESVRRQNGRLPDNFVDSAEGAYPEIPPTGNLLALVDAAAAGLAERPETGESDPSSIDDRSRTDE
jgi:hypothetical protein